MIFSEALAKVAQDYLHNGSKVYLEGSLQTRKWQGQDDQDRYSTEVVLQGFNAALTLLDPKPSGTSSQPSEEVAPVHGKTTPSKAPTSPPRTDWSRKPDDEIPL